MTISIYRYGHTAALALEGWDPNDSPRGRALYAALDVAPDDYEYALAQHQIDGRWGLFGHSVEGNRYAVEDSSST